MTRHRGFKSYISINKTSKKNLNDLFNNSVKRRNRKIPVLSRKLAQRKLRCKLLQSRGPQLRSNNDVLLFVLPLVQSPIIDCMLSEKIFAIYVGIVPGWKTTRQGVFALVLFLSRKNTAKVSFKIIFINCTGDCSTTHPLPRAPAHATTDGPRRVATWKEDRWKEKR